MIRLLIVLILISSAHVSAATKLIREDKRTLTLSVTEAMVMGDNDTLANARALNIEQIKKSASDYAGSYVESELKVTDSRITKQQVRVLTAGFIEITDSTDSRRLNQSGSVVLTTTATVRMSQEAIRNGLEKLKNDPERRQKMEVLRKDNQRLRKELFELTRQINTGKARTDLMAARNAILQDLDNNRESSRQVFEEGTLFQLATLGNDEYELARQDIDNNVFGFIQHEAQIKTGRPQFTKNNDGSYNIAVPVTWSFDHKPAYQTLDKYLEVSQGKGRHAPPSAFKFSEYHNKGNRQKLPFTEKLLDYITNKTIALRVNAGSKQGYLPIGNMGSFFNDDFFFQYSGSPGKDMISLMYRNPIIIRKVSESELKKITALSASVEILNREELRGWKYE